MCLTTSKSKSASKPCHFPFKYFGRVYKECTLKHSNDYWCATGAEYESGEWGYCNEYCSPRKTK